MIQFSAPLRCESWFRITGASVAVGTSVVLICYELLRVIADISFLVVTRASLRVQSLVESVSECKICRVYPIGIKYSVRRYVRRISMQSVWAYIHWPYIRHLHGTRALVGVSARPHSRARERLHIWNEDVNVVVLPIGVSHESRTNGSAMWLREINFFTRAPIE